MTVDEAVRDLLNISTDIVRVAVLGPEGEVLAAAPAAAGPELAPAAGRLWAAAETSAGSSSIDNVVVQDAQGAVALLQAHGRRIAAVTGPRPAVGLLLFDLRTCLGDAYAEEAQ